MDKCPLCARTCQVQDWLLAQAYNGRAALWQFHTCEGCRTALTDDFLVYAWAAFDQMARQSGGGRVVQLDLVDLLGGP